MQNNLSAIVLAAGEGRRMQPLGANVPKVMLPVLGKPVLAHVLQNIIDAGLTEATIVVLKKTAHQITKYFTNTWNGLDIKYVHIKEALGPAYALNEVKDYIKTEYFLVQFGDSLSDENLPKKIIETLAKNPKIDGVLAVREVDDPSRYGIVKYNKNQIVSIIDKPGVNKAPSNHAVIGTFILKTALFKKSIENQKFTQHHQLFPAEYLLKNGAKMASYFFKGNRVDLGKPEDLFNASKLLASTPVKCIAFDADNTLYNSRQAAPAADKAALELLSKKIRRNSKDLYKQWQEIVSTIKNSKDPNERTRLHSYGQLCKKCEIDASLAKKMFEAFTKALLKNLKSPVGLKEILKTLPQDKYVITDDITTLSEKKLKHLGLDNFFEEVITSDKVKTTKPSKNFYQKLLEKYHPEEILVVGDNWQKDLEIPASLGMQVLFAENEESLEKLKTLIEVEPIRIHIMGIGGAGAAAAAGIAKGYGYKVSGCDIANDSPYTQNLDVKIKNGHSPIHIKNIDLLVASPAVEKLDPKNPEVLKAKELKIPVLTWQQFQGKYLQKNKFVICVAGTYGKSTTTAMISQILIDAGLDPSCEIGAKVLAWQKNFKVGKSKYYVCEGDEYNNNFLNYQPDIAVVLNTAWDHPDFFKTQQSVINSYQEFVDKIKAYGTLIIGPDPKLNQLKESKVGSNPSTLRIKDFGSYQLSIIGEFRKENANAALSVAYVLGLNTKKAKKSIEAFGGIGRRLEYKGKVNGVKVYDDYAVQPYTVKTTTNALAAIYPRKKIALVFEPHTFSRIKTFFNSFVEALKDIKVDRVLITNVYAAREHGDKKKLASELAISIGTKAKYTGSLEETANYLKNNLSNFDIILSMGAGDIYKLYKLIK